MKIQKRVETSKVWTVIKGDDSHFDPNSFETDQFVSIQEIHNHGRKDGDFYTKESASEQAQELGFDSDSICQIVPAKINLINL